MKKIRADRDLLKYFILNLDTRNIGSSNKLKANSKDFWKET